MLAGFIKFFAFQHSETLSTLHLCPQKSNMNNRRYENSKSRTNITPIQEPASKLQSTRFSKFLTRGLPDSYAHYCWESKLSLRLRRLVCEGLSLPCLYLQHASYIYMTSTHRFSSVYHVTT